MIGGLHARRFVEAGCTHVADLGSGIGADAIALASAELKVTAVERDETTAAALTLNLMPFPQATVVHGQAEDVDLEAVDGSGWILPDAPKPTAPPSASSTPSPSPLPCPLSKPWWMRARMWE